MVRCSIFGEQNKTGKQKKKTSGSLTREETIATAFFNKCRVKPASSASVTTECPACTSVSVKEPVDESKDSWLAPLL